MDMSHHRILNNMMQQSTCTMKYGEHNACSSPAMMVVLDGMMASFPHMKCHNMPLEMP